MVEKSKKKAIEFQTNTRKLTLWGWMYANHLVFYHHGLKPYYFLFLYEAFSRTYQDGSADLNDLIGSRSGPIFHTVLEEHGSHRSAFERAAVKCYKANKSILNEDRLEICTFLTDILSNSELRELTRAMHIWQAKKADIEASEYLYLRDNPDPVWLNEQDFDEHDMKIICTLSDMYPLDNIRNMISVRLGETSFLFSKENADRLTRKQMAVLDALCINEDLHNPVYVQIDEDGRLIID